MKKIAYSIATTIVIYLMLAVIGRAQVSPWIHDAGTDSLGTLAAVAPLPGGGVVIGTESHGVYVAPRFGGTWTAADQGLTGQNMRALVADAQGRLFAGTEGSGLFVSTDGGATWAAVAGVAAHNVEAMTIGRDGAVYAATDIGVVRSSDHGSTWQSIGPHMDTWTVAAAATGTVVTAVPDVGAYRSTDGGAHWAAIPSLAVTGITSMHVTRSGVFFAASSGVYVSTDDGATWSSTGFTAPVFTSVVSDSSGNVFTGSLDGVARSGDGGGHWLPFDNGLPDVGIACLAPSSDGYLYAGAFGGGLYRTAAVTAAVEPDAGRAAGVVVDSPFPNPASTVTVLPFNLPRAANVRLTVVDMRGVQVADLPDHLMESGAHILSLPVEEFPVGRYLCRLQIDGISFVVPLVVAH